jgi:hypothetical protein
LQVVKRSLNSLIVTSLVNPLMRISKPRSLTGSGALPFLAGKTDLDTERPLLDLGGVALPELLTLLDYIGF